MCSWVREMNECIASRQTSPMLFAPFHVGELGRHHVRDEADIQTDDLTCASYDRIMLELKPTLTPFYRHKTQSHYVRKFDSEI